MIHNIKIISDKYGVLLNENFIDKTQFKIFVKSVHGALVLDENLSFFNGDSMLIHIPAKQLKESIILTSLSEVSITDHVKSKIESLV